MPRRGDVKWEKILQTREMEHVHPKVQNQLNEWWGLKQASRDKDWKKV